MINEKFTLFLLISSVNCGGSVATNGDQAINLHSSLTLTCDYKGFGDDGLISKFLKYSDLHKISNINIKIHVKDTDMSAYWK